MEHIGKLMQFLGMLNACSNHVAPNVVAGLFQAYGGRISHFSMSRVFRC